MDWAGAVKMLSGHSSVLKQMQMFRPLLVVLVVEDITGFGFGEFT